MDQDFQDEVLGMVYFTDQQELEAYDSDSSTPSDVSDDMGTKRYFVDNMQTCFTCGQKGHVVRDCPDVLLHPCLLCGEIGHNRVDCPKEICFNCYRCGHQSRNCGEQSSYRQWCDWCRMSGHLPRDCSLVWRQYVFTKHVPYSVFSKDVDRVKRSCYNCASVSHFGDDCPDKKQTLTAFHEPIYDLMQQSVMKIRKLKQTEEVEEAEKGEEEGEELDTQDKNDDKNETVNLDNEIRNLYSEKSEKAKTNKKSNRYKGGFKKKEK